MVGNHFSYPNKDTYNDTYKINLFKLKIKNNNFYEVILILTRVDTT